MLFFLFYFLTEIYTVVLFIFLLIQFARRKKLPRFIIVLNGLCIIGFLWLKHRVEEHKIIFTGSYGTADDWGQGLSNVMVTLMNLAVVYLLLLANQLAFFIFYLKEFRKLNRKIEEENANEFFQ